MFQPIHRRSFLQTGLAAVGAAMFLPSSRSMGSMLLGSNVLPPWTPPGQSGPFLRLPGLGNTFSNVTTVGGLPFCSKWYGDEFPPNYLPFHVSESPDAWARIDEETDIVIVGGGLSGMATAHGLRERDWVMFDLRPRFGGCAMGENWKRMPYSLGSAYFIVPDEGDEFDKLYSELGVYDLAEVDEGEGFQVEFGGKIISDLCSDCSPEEHAGMVAYQKAVKLYANETYPDIPWSDRASKDLVRSLDNRSFGAEIDAVCGGHVPPMLARALQAYCYSSFGVGWEDLSAAAGWNFVAAEEFGRIVLPGGNTGLASLLWQSLQQRPDRPNGRPRMRAGCIVTDVKMVAQGVIVAWRDATGATHTLGARKVVFAGSKHIVRHVMPDIEQLDPEKYQAMQDLPTTPYLVANVLLNRKVDHEWYDLFTIHDEQFPMDGNAFENDRRITDALNGTFSVASAHPNADVLTLYWPLPWHTARFTCVQDNQWHDYAVLAAPQIHRALEVLGVNAADVAAVRLARWGHAMPFARAGTYSTDQCEILRRPIDDRVWFANQDNWLLPAVETCLSEASWVTTNLR